MKAHEELLEKGSKYTFTKEGKIDLHIYNTKDNVILFNIDYENDIGFAIVSKDKKAIVFCEVPMLELAIKWINEYKKGLFVGGRKYRDYY